MKKEMKKEMKKKVFQSANMIETFIAILLSIVIGILSIFLVSEFISLLIQGKAVQEFNEFLATALSLVIGVEFIKMLTKHTPETVIEVLMFAIARQLIVEHTSTFENLAGILGIAVLFAIRKFLFIQSDSYAEEEDNDDD